jgi:class 3 adenylate cyclase
MQKCRHIITISKGKTLEANIGAELKLDRTYIGVAVNVCSRLETVAKFYGLDLIVTKEIIDDLPEYKEDGCHDFGKADISEEWSKISLDDILMQIENQILLS